MSVEARRPSEAITLRVIAHRAGNDLVAARRLWDGGVSAIEADLRRWRGRIVVRHLKSLGPLPYLWDRWVIERARDHKLELAELLASTPADVALVLDLKGWRRRLALDVRTAVAPYLATHDVTVCARSWGLLAPFAGTGVRRLRSIGGPVRLAAALRLAGDCDGCAVHERLLDAEVVRRLKRRGRIVATWPVNDPVRARDLLAIGVDALISDRALELEVAR